MGERNLTSTNETHQRPINFLVVLILLTILLVLVAVGALRLWRSESGCPSRLGLPDRSLNNVDLLCLEDLGSLVGCDQSLHVLSLEIPLALVELARKLLTRLGLDRAASELELKDLFTENENVSIVWIRDAARSAD